jgi:hypothetical protein
MLEIRVRVGMNRQQMARLARVDVGLVREVEDRGLRGQPGSQVEALVEAYEALDSVWDTATRALEILEARRRAADPSTGTIVVEPA